MMINYVSKLLILIICVLPIKSYANDVDYLAYMERMDLMVELVVSAKSCEGLGMNVNWEKMKTIQDDMMADAIRNGIDVKTFAEPNILTTLRKKRKENEYLTNYYKEKPDKIEEFADYWANKCYKLGTNELTKQYIQLEKQQKQ